MMLILYSLSGFPFIKRLSFPIRGVKSNLGIRYSLISKDSRGKSSKGEISAIAPFSLTFNFFKFLKFLIGVKSLILLLCTINSSIVSRYAIDDKSLILFENKTKDLSLDNPVMPLKSGLKYAAKTLIPVIFLKYLKSLTSEFGSEAHWMDALSKDNTSEKLETFKYSKSASFTNSGSSSVSTICTFAFAVP